MPHSVRIADPRCKFSSSHFLTEHAKCSRLHGHNYLLMVEVTGPLNDQFFVVDFFILKQKLLALADELDHAIILPTESPKIKIEEKGTQVHVSVGGKDYEFPQMDVRMLPIKATTAELLAKYIYEKLKADYADYSLKVEVAESEGSIAAYWE